MESIPISGVNGECIRVDISLVFAEGKVRLGHLHILDLVLVSETEVPRVTRDALCNLEGFFFSLGIWKMDEKSYSEGQSM